MPKILQIWKENRGPMSEEDLTGLATVVNALSDSLESSMASAITEPIAGWVGTFLSFGQGDDGALSTITQNLTDLIADVNQLQSDLSAQLQAIGTQIQATAVLPA